MATNAGASPDPVPLARGRDPESFTQLYRPDAAAVDELVEALYRLLLDVPATDAGAVVS